MNKDDIWFACNMIVRRSLKHYSHLYSLMNRHGVKDLLDLEQSDKISTHHYQVSELGKYGVQGPLAILGEAFGCMGVYRSEGLGPIFAGRQDSTSLDVEWMDYQETTNGSRHSGTFLAGRIDKGINAFSIQALSKVKAKFKILVSCSVTAEESIQRRDENRHMSMMRELEIIHVAPFWVSSMKREAKFRIGRCY